MSNMGYLSTLLTPDVREKTGPKNGAVSIATVNIDPLGAVTVTADVTVQGQSHETVLAQIVADELGLSTDDVEVVLELDTAKDQWSIAAGTYSSRFAGGTAVAAHMAAGQMREKIKAIAAKQLNVLPEDVELSDGKVRSRSNPDNALPFSRVAATSNWAPTLLPEGMAPALSETGVWTPPELEAPTRDDKINTSLTYGFIFDMCGIEIDPLSYQVRVDRYVSMHDAGRIMNPMIATGQIRGAFAQGVATALYEEFSYNEEGAFLSGTFADYLVPTVSEIPPLEILHYESPSPLTPLGAKGLAEGNCMTTPVCIANAIADALGVADVPLPATPQRIHAMMEAARAAETHEAKSMKPRPFDYAQARYGGGGDCAPRRIRRRGARARRRPVAVADAQSAADRSGGADRYFAHQGARCHPRPRRQDRNRRRGDAEQALGAGRSSKAKLPLVAAALPYVGHFQTRNRGTVCGSIAHADPSSELPLALAVSGGEVVLRSARGTRILPASEFQEDMLTTAREADELVAAVRFPVATGQGVGFHEVARRHGDFAIIAVAAAVENNKAIRVGVGGMAGRPMVRSLNGNR